MLDNIRRKFSYSNVKVFYIKQYELGVFNDLICDGYSICSMSAERCITKTSTSSFKRFHKTLKDVSLNGVHMKMLPCPAGTFIMGHQDQEYNQPIPEVIEGSFLLGETEVTQELYQAVMGTNPSRYQNRPKNPVEKVSWEDAILFCNELSKLQGLDLCYTRNSNRKYDWACDFGKNGFRLPKEKEWEYAAKAGTNNQWAGTNKEVRVSDYAWFEEDESTGSTHEVKTKKPNEWGFYDMSGNVWEWCWDKWDTNSGPSGYRVYRGGSWGDKALDLRSAYRGMSQPESRDLPNGHWYNRGFRVCRSIVN